MQSVICSFDNDEVEPMRQLMHKLLLMRVCSEALMPTAEIRRMDGIPTNSQ